MPQEESLASTYPTGRNIAAHEDASLSDHPPSRSHTCKIVTKEEGDRLKEEGTMSHPPALTCHVPSQRMEESLRLQPTGTNTSAVHASTTGSKRPKRQRRVRSGTSGIRPRQVAHPSSACRVPDRPISCHPPGFSVDASDGHRFRSARRVLLLLRFAEVAVVLLLLAPLPSIYHRIGAGAREAWWWSGL
uniref:Uncharacterized protein n=1 Tax=Oryza punctata TaxID=4537 RepID=A0A0E0L262_ORYPU